MLRYTILIMFLSGAVMANENNRVMQACLVSQGYTVDNFQTFDWSKAAACHSDYRVGKNTEALAEMRDFLKHNPRYRYPGQSLNRCWGKEREMPFEKSTLTVGPNGMEAKIWYKDKIPAGCYENGPWDNRDKD